MKRILLVVLMLAGCATGVGVRELEVSGFTLVQAASGPHHQLWVKEAQDGGRRLQLCIVPTVPTREYYWNVRVSVDGVPVWGEGGTVQTVTREKQAACVTSKPLAQGRVSYWTSFQYKGSGGQSQSVPSPSASPQPGTVNTRIASRPEATDGAPTSALAPTWERGYEWKFRWTSPRGSGTFFWTMIREEIIAGVPHYVLQSDNREIYYTKSELAWLVDRVDGAVDTQATPAERRFEWPLTVAKQWETRVQVERPLQRTTEERRRVATVEAWETVTVPAGTFGAFHIVVKDPTGKTTSESWFAPEARQVVKDKTYYDYGVRERELLEYKLRAIVAPAP
jgi:hypothetical protein